MRRSQLIAPIKDIDYESKYFIQYPELEPFLTTTSAITRFYSALSNRLFQQPEIENLKFISIQFK